MLRCRCVDGRDGWLSFESGSLGIFKRPEDMLFNSMTFAAFLAVVFTLYWVVPNRKFQNVFLLVVSYVFYGWWDWRYLSLIAGCSAVNYAAGALIASRNGKRVQRVCLTIACVVSLGTLAAFKYFNFFVGSFAAMCEQVGIHWTPWVLNLALPVGISFFTFQALSYTIDIALGKLKAADSWIEFFAFISFFPQLVAGPIERASNLLPQFQRNRTFDADVASHGLCLIAYGLFKKMVVADTLSLYVNNAFANPGFYSSVTCVIGAIFFSLQIYCDFSGYSDVARGVAKLFGFELMLNFDRPYLSKSFAEFWRRWHISLSSWFKDYVYIPLGGNRVSFPKMLRNLWIVFLLSGLWHGASWAFVLWGGLHALFITLGSIGRQQAKSISEMRLLTKIWKILVVDIGVALAWILFRAGSLDKAVAYLKAMFSCNFKTSMMALCAGLGPMTFLFCCGVAALLLLSYLAPRDCRFSTRRGQLGFICLCIAAIVFCGMPSGGEFMYFQF